MKSVLTAIVIFLQTLTLMGGEPPVFVNDMLDAIALSENNNKDILVIFTADWCKYCQIMKKDIEQDQKIVSDKIVCYIDIDNHNNKDIIKQYKVKTIPDYCILRKRIEIKRTRGYTTKDKFIKWIQDDK
jgi:thioredoxin 1